MYETNAVRLKERLKTDDLSPKWTAMGYSILLWDWVRRIHRRFSPG